MRRHITMRLTAALALTTVFQATALSQGRPVAKVVGTKGKVSIVAPTTQAAAQLFQPLYAGDRVKVEAGGEIILMIRATGTREVIKTPGTVTVKRTGCVPKGSVQKLGEPGSSRPILPRLIKQVPAGRSGVGILRGTLDEVHPASPIHGTTVLKRQPEFRWDAVKGAIGYEVYLYEAGQKRKLLRKQTTKPTLTLKDLELEPGKDYEWEVAYIKSDGTGDTLRKSVDEKFKFKLAAAETITLATDLSELLDRTDDNGDLSFLTAASLFYRDGKHIDEELAACQRLAKLRPESAAVQARLAVLYEQIGRPDQYATARAQAEKLGHKFETK